jgi:hypothetical protein
MMPVVEAASREGRGVGAVLGSAERAALLAVPRDAVALKVGDVDRQQRRAEGAPPMADRPGLDDDATIGGEQTAAAESGPASLERQAAVPRTNPSAGRRTWFGTWLPPGAQNPVDEALAAARIADGSHQDLELEHGVNIVAVTDRGVPGRPVRPTRMTTVSG